MLHAIKNSPLFPKLFIEWLLAILFIVSPFYIAASIGGTGLALPFNITVWLAATWIISYALWHTARQADFIFPRNARLLLALPAGILVSAVLAGVHEPTEWLFRIVTVMAGVIFLFGLFQFPVKNIDRLLLLLACATLLHSLYGMVQLFRPAFIISWLPMGSSSQPTGVFQQVNVMASFLVTGSLICWYLLLRPLSFKRRALSLLLMITISLATYVVVASGSRVGLLSALLAMTLLFAGYFRQVKKRPRRVILTIILMLVAAWFAQDGLHKTLDKSYQIIAPNYADARLIIYRVSLETISQAPLLGHGIGSFLQQWGQASAAFYQQHPVDKMPQYIAHPHNELLLWAIEGGLVALLGILVSMLSVIWLALRFKKQRVFAYLALLLPISFHTQVELPFYLSALHWFIWLFLLYVLLKPMTFRVANPMSDAARKSLTAVALGLLVISNSVLFHTVFAQQQLTDFINQRQSTPSLKQASLNPYFKNDAEKIILRTHLHQAIEQQDRAKISETIQWIERHISNKPELRLFGDVLDGYLALQDSNGLCRSVVKGLSYYPANQALQDLQTQQCLKR